MRGRERRLHTVATRLTVRQRVVALLAAEPGDDALRDSLWRGLTPGERAAFRRDCARLTHLDATAHLCLAWAACQVGALEAVAGWFTTVHLGAVLAESLEDALDFGEPRRGPGAGGDGDLNKAARQVARRLQGLAAGAGGRRWPGTAAADPRRPPPRRRPRAAPPAPRVGDRGRGVRRGTRRRSARPRPPGHRGPLPRAAQAASRSARAGPAHRADRAIRRVRRPARRALPPQGGFGRCRLVSYLPDPDPIAPLTIRYLWYRSGGVVRR